MERRVKIICSIVGFLGLLSAATGFAAEAKRIKDSQVQYTSTSECVYPRSPALGLGLTAAVALLVAQIIINAETGCAALNDQHGEKNFYFGYYYCFVVKPGVFAGAAVLSLATVVLGIIYYLSMISAKNMNNQLHPPNQGGIVMGQPQFPTQNTQEPVFVHEDTYMRRQLA
nr:Fc receptor-like protein [Ipomoea batatas]GMC68251.1 Fc receptor-like protein [Ipomoea batatas]GMC68383.1 Fc receptor-like protein [Ipomoea batatas]GMC68385.1 Fc receptor-like protein [Ipomoea batatas]